MLFGGPTIELFNKSYNLTHPTEMFEEAVVSWRGYGVRKYGSNSSFYYSLRASNAEVISGLYGLKQGNVDAYFIASPRYVY